MAKRLQTFNVTARIHAIAGIDIKAESLEDAVAKSKELDVTDFIKFLDEHSDSNLIIANVGRSQYWRIDQDES